jgi:hypothetical protein
MAAAAEGCACPWPDRSADRPVPVPTAQSPVVVDCYSARLLCIGQQLQSKLGWAGLLHAAGRILHNVAATDIIFPALFDSLLSLSNYNSFRDVTCDLTNNTVISFCVSML